MRRIYTSCRRVRIEILTCSLVGALCEDLWCSESRGSSSWSHLWLSLLIKTKLEDLEGHSSKKGKETSVYLCVQRLPGEADIAHTVSHVAVTGEALLYAPLRFLTAALGPGQQEAPAH